MKKNGKIYLFYKKHQKTINRTIGIIGIASLVGLFSFGKDVYQLWNEHRKTESYKYYILHELNSTRNQFVLILNFLKCNVRARPNVNLLHRNKIAEIFIDNSKLCNKVVDLYASFENAKVSATELRELLLNQNANLETIQNRINDIITSIKLSDEIGPKIANFVGGTWEKKGILECSALFAYLNNQRSQPSDMHPASDSQVYVNVPSRIRDFTDILPDIP